MAALKHAVKIMFLAVLFLFVVGAAESAQPSLPSLIYGRVINPDYVPASGVAVKATFTDTDGVQRTIATTTLAGVNSGYYFFNQGYLQAAEGSTITVVAGGVTKTVPASPGGNLVKVDSHLLATPDNGQPGGSGGYGGVGGGSTGAGAGSAGGGVGQGTAFGEPDPDAEGGDFPGRLSLAELLQAGARVLSGALKDEEIEDVPEFNARGLQAMQRQLMAQDMAVKGRVLDEEGKPMPDYRIKARWKDSEGEYHETETRTLSKEEAEALGDEALIGQYWFTKEELKPEPDSEVTIETDQDEITVHLDQENPVEAVHSLKQKDDIARSVTVEDKVYAAEGYAIQIKDMAKKNIRWIIILLICILLATVIYYWDNIQSNFNSVMDTVALSGLQRRVIRLQDSKCKSYLTKEVATVSPDVGIKNVISTFITSGISSLVVVQASTPIGIITQSDVLKLALKKDITKCKVSDCMSTPLKHITPGMSFSQIVRFSQQHNISKLPVLKNNCLAGIMTQTDISRELDRFFEEYSFESDLPIVQSSMSQAYVQVKESDSVPQALKKMYSDDADSIVILESNRLKGLITERDIISEIYNNPLFLKNMTAAQLMGLRIFHVIPGTYATEANKLMLEHQVKTLAVVTQGRLSGIITQKDIIGLLSGFLESVLEEANELKNA